MASEIRQYSLTIPAGTPSVVPAVKQTTFPARIVEAIEITVPAGSNGTVGFQIRNSNIVVIPYNSDTWIVSSGENIHWDLQDQITSGSWQLAGYNEGVYPHTIYIRYLLSPPPTAASTPGIASVISANSLIPPDTTTDSLDLTDYSSIIAAG